MYMYMYMYIHMIVFMRNSRHMPVTLYSDVHRQALTVGVSMFEHLDIHCIASPFSGGMPGKLR